MGGTLAITVDPTTAGSADQVFFEAVARTDPARGRRSIQWTLSSDECYGFEACAAIGQPPRASVRRLRAKSLQVESRFRSKYSFGRMILSEKSATFRIML